MTGRTLNGRSNLAVKTLKPRWMTAPEDVDVKS